MLNVGDMLLSGIVVAIGASTTRSTALEIGRQYLITADADCVFHQGGSAVDADTGTAGCGFLGKGGGVTIGIKDANSQYVAVIGHDGSTGFLYIQQIQKALV